MIDGKRIAVVLPAYNAAKTLRKTLEEIPTSLVDDIILVDDHSSDSTVAVAQQCHIEHLYLHERNLGYGANQKTCYKAALSRNADIVIMLHPDYQYTPKLLAPMAYMLASGLYDVALASRILGRGCLKGGMPRYKYIANRFLTLVQNLLLGQHLSEYHTGYRAYTAETLRTLPYQQCSNDFIFDNQFLALAFGYGFRIGEISCPTRYFPEAASIKLRRSMTSGIGGLRGSLAYRFLHRYRKPKGKR